MSIRCSGLYKQRLLKPLRILRYYSMTIGGFDLYAWGKVPYFRNPTQTCDEDEICFPRTLLDNNACHAGGGLPVFPEGAAWPAAKR